MKYKVDDIVVYNKLKIKILENYSTGHYRVSYITNKILLTNVIDYRVSYINDKILLTNVIDSNYLDRNSTLHIKYMRKEKLNKLYDTSTMVK